MIPSRTALLACVVLAATALAGCGSDDLSPHTNACRSFELHGGSSSPVLTADVVHYLAGDGGVGEVLTADAGTIRAAAIDAGLTKNLPEADYRVFKTLVHALDTFLGQLAAAVDAQPVDASVAVPVQKAIKAAVSSCA